MTEINSNKRNKGVEVGIKPRFWRIIKKGDTVRMCVSSRGQGPKYQREEDCRMWKETRAKLVCERPMRPIPKE